MTLLPLALGTGRLGSAAPAAGAPLDPADPAERQRLFERDGHACRWCGFVSRKYHELAPINGDPADTRADNLATACIFCHQALLMERVAEMRSGALIWLPELDQRQLHEVARALYIARVTPGPMADAARAALDPLIQRREEARRRLGTDEPGVLAQVLSDYLPDKAYARRADRLDGIRLMPLDRRVLREGDMEFNQFPQILAWWRSKDGPFAGLMPQTWPDLFRRLAA